VQQIGQTMSWFDTTKSAVANIANKAIKLIRSVSGPTVSDKANTSKWESMPSTSGPYGATAAPAVRKITSLQERVDQRLEERMDVDMHSLKQEKKREMITSASDYKISEMGDPNITSDVTKVQVDQSVQELRRDGGNSEELEVEEVDYCVLCQEGHMISESCLQDIQCKTCGKKGHLRIHCRGQDVLLSQEKQDEKQPRQSEDSSKEVINDGGSSLGRGIKRKSEQDLRNVLKITKRDKTFLNYESFVDVGEVDQLKIPKKSEMAIAESSGKDSKANAKSFVGPSQGENLPTKATSFNSKSKPEDCSMDKHKQPKESKHQEKKSPILKDGTYHIVSVHIEQFRSNKSPSTKLTQIGCVVSGSKPSSFFRAIKPRGLEKFLDSKKLSGDLLQALHMTREEDGKFLFRSQFEIVQENNKIVCVEESEALKGLLDFLEDFPNCIILGVDEDSISILVEKLRDANKDRFRQLITGFTYWKRVLKYLDVDGYRTIDLEEFHSKMVQEDLPGFTTASDIASVLLKSVEEVTARYEKGRKVMTKLFYKLCKRIECLEYPKMVDYDRDASNENVEVFNSFRPYVSTTFSAEKLEQVTLSSESDSEPDQPGISYSGSGRVVKEEKQVLSVNNAAEERSKLNVPLTVTTHQSFKPNTCSSTTSVHQFLPHSKSILPPELLSQFMPSQCNLCFVKPISEKCARMHYEGKLHSKNVETYLNISSKGRKDAPGEDDNSCKIFVTQINSKKRNYRNLDLTKDDIKNHFERYGKKVTDVVFFPSTRGPGNIACVEFSESKEAMILCLMRQEMVIKKIKVKIEAASSAHLKYLYRYIITPPTGWEAGSSRDFSRGGYRLEGCSRGDGNMGVRNQIGGFGNSGKKGRFSEGFGEERGRRIGGNVGRSEKVVGF